MKMKRVICAMFCISLCAAVVCMLPQPAESRPFVDQTFCMNAQCHVLATLQAQHQGECTICHAEPEPQVVYADVCSQCHPLNNASQCNLIRLHDDVPPEPPVTVNGLYCIDCHANCQGTTPGGPCDINVLQDQLARSRWFPLPASITIVGTETDFKQFGTKVELTPEQSARSVIKLGAITVPFAQTIQQFILVMPSILTGVGADGESETVTVKVTNGGCDIALDTFELQMIPIGLDK
jgi:hypothetical protein